MIAKFLQDVYGLVVRAVGGSLALGTRALISLTSGTANTVVGVNAGDAITTGTNHTAVGFGALGAATVFNDNTAIGNLALASADGNYNTALGSRAGFAVTSGVDNTAVGFQALTAIVGNSGCVSVGFQSLLLATGGTNTAVGWTAGNIIVGGTGNVCIGYDADASGAAAINQIVIGASAVGVADNQVVLGNTSVTTLRTSGKFNFYGNVAAVGWGVPAIYGSGSIDATTNARSAAVATYTVGAADGVFDVGGNVNVTTSTTHSFSLDVVYTDETNTSRTLVLPVVQLTGSFVASGLITNVTGAGPYESAVVRIRAKAATAITIRPSAGGTYTAVVYNVQANIMQVG